MLSAERWLSYMCSLPKNKKFKSVYDILWWYREMNKRRKNVDSLVALHYVLHSFSLDLTLLSVLKSPGIILYRPVSLLQVSDWCLQSQNELHSYGRQFVTSPFFLKESWICTPSGTNAIFYTLYTTCPSITTFSVAFTALDVSSIYMWPRAAALRPIDHFSELFNMRSVVGGLTYCSNWEYFMLCCIRTGSSGLGWETSLNWNSRLFQNASVYWLN